MGKIPDPYPNIMYLKIESTSLLVTIRKKIVTRTNSQYLGYEKFECSVGFYKNE